MRFSLCLRVSVVRMKLFFSPRLSVSAVKISSGFSYPGYCLKNPIEIVDIHKNLAYPERRAEESRLKSSLERDRQMNAWKSVALTLIFILLSIIVFNLFNPGAPKTDEKMSRRYESYMDDVEKKDAEYRKRIDADMEKANAIYDLSLSNQKRFEKLLERWEKQTDRMDKALSRLEQARSRN